MERLTKNVWFAIVAVCLILTVGTAVIRIASNSKWAEEVSLETVKGLF